jgi:phosphoglycerol transferase MdoB-like AlkP superfamily enzyme
VELIAESFDGDGTVVSASFIQRARLGCDRGRGVQSLVGSQVAVTMGRLLKPLVRLGRFHVVMTAVTAAYIWILSSEQRSDWHFLFSFVTSLINVYCLTQLTIAWGGRSRRQRYRNSFGLVLVMLLLLGYHDKTRVMFDPRVVFEQRNTSLSLEVLDVIQSSINWTLVAIGLAMFFLLLWLDGRKVNAFPILGGKLWRARLGPLAVYAVNLASPFAQYDELTALFRRLFHQQSLDEYSVELTPGEYPLRKPFVPANTRVTDTRHRDVFLILVESFNARFVEARAKNEKTYTPFLNSILSQGLYVERFYGNSIQTAKGHFATLCSVIPVSRGIEYRRFANDTFNCLPQILKTSSYTNVFFQAQSDLNYDNARPFLKKIGFDRVESVVTHERDGDEKDTWGWGLQDNVFYRRFFEYLDSSGLGAEGQKPLFVTLAPISNHMRFDRVPEGRRAIYEDPSKPEEKYANSVNIADQGLRAFFEELRRRSRYNDAIVIITGDHSYPVGEHGFNANEAEAFEEFFRTPLLVIAPSLVEPERVAQVPYSQLDIAPTVLELTRTYPKWTHFMGRSLLERPRKVQPIPLVQPYSGGYLGVVEYPFKYVHHVEKNEGRLFDLSKDPNERKNLVTLTPYLERTARLSRFLRQQFLVDAALEQDLVWPRTEK